MEFFETVFEGDGSRRLRGGIAVPTPEFCNDPRGPRKASIGMRILLQRCLAFEGGVETLERGNFVRAEGDGGRFALGTIAGLQELHRDRGGLGGVRRELDEALGGF